MDKKQFFESLVSLLPDNSGHRLNSLGKIQEVCTSIKAGLSDPNLQNEFELIEKEILLHAWMFEQACNGDIEPELGNEETFWPLIVISVLGEIIFVNRAYCRLSGFSPSEIQSREKAGTLYENIYSWQDLDHVNKAIARLHAGKGYRHLELHMEKSGQNIAWTSYGWVGESLEIRSGRKISSENNQENEQDRFYRGNILNTARIVENLYQVCIHGILSVENEQKLIWIQDFLSMFSFLWNHSELFMESVDLPTTKTGKIYGSYNTVYAQFFRSSFQKQKKFKDTLTTVHNTTVSDFLSTRTAWNTHSQATYMFHQNNKTPVAMVSWKYSIYPYEIPLGYHKIFWVGTLARKIQKENLLVRIFRRIFKINSPQS